MDDELRIGDAAEWLGVSVDTLRRWGKQGRLNVVRTAGGQRVVSRVEVGRLMAARRKPGSDRPIVGQSARIASPASSRASRRIASRRWWKSRRAHIGSSA